MYVPCNTSSFHKFSEKVLTCSSRDISQSTTENVAKYFFTSFNEVRKTISGKSQL